MNKPVPAPVSKLPDCGTTIFTVMSKLAAEHGAINLSQGFPDFDGPPLLRERVAWHMANGHNQYAPLAGVPALCEQIAAKLLDLYGRSVDPAREVVVTPGATEALFGAISVLVHPGDEAIIIDPAYDTYEPCVRLNGGIARRIPTRWPDFRIDWQRVREAVNSRTRVILLNSPHNPTGSTLDASDIAALRALVADHGLHIIADEVYEHICFAPDGHQSISRYPDLAARAFVVSSFGKTYHATGWRVGYCVAPAPLMVEFLRIHQFINFSTNAPLQYAIADFMRACPEHHRELSDFYRPRRDLFCQLLQDAGFTLTPASGTYFQLANYAGLSDLPDTEFCRWLTTEIGVAAIPISVFYAEPPEQQVVRFCFAKQEATLRTAAERLAALTTRSA